MNGAQLEDLRRSLSAAKTLCLFGIGVLFLDCFDQLVLALGRRPDVLCDNSEGKWGKAFCGVNCVAPSDLLALREGLVVVVAVRNPDAICLQLRSMGIENVFSVVYDRGVNVVSSIRRPADWLTEPLRKIDVKGKWTLVTGASRGIGRLVAVEMARLGSNIIAHSRAPSHLGKVMEECASFGVQSIPLAAELGDLDALESMFLKLSELPPVDIAFNNAGVALGSPLWSLDGKAFLDCMAVNAFAPAAICQRLAPAMAERGFGRIVNVTSSIEGRPFDVGYACSKAALNKYVRDMAQALCGSGAMISLADPGWLSTDMGGPSAPSAPESVIPGILIGALLDMDVNGRWISAQNYAGLNLDDALKKAASLLH